MDLSKIKEWLKNKPKWLVILVTILCCLGIGVGVWFGVSSCASVDIDKFNVNTDKVQVDVEGVKVHPKDVSLINSRDDAFALCDYIETVSANMSKDDKLDLLDNYGMNFDTYYVLLNSYGLVIDNHIVYRVEDL